MLDLYKLAADPDKVHGHETAYETVPRLVWEKYHNKHSELKKREYLWIQSVDLAASYAHDIIKGRWPEAEPTIMKDPDYKRLYMSWCCQNDSYVKLV